MHRQIAQVLRENRQEPSGRHPQVQKSRSRVRPWKGLLFLFVAGFCFNFLGCEDEQKIHRGVLSGKVLDTVGNRIVGAEVTSHRSLNSAVTGADGRYAFTSLDAGSHRILVQREGFKPASKTVSLDFGQVDQGFDFTLEPLPNRISWNVYKRDRASVTVDVTSVEPMRCVAIYQGEHLPQMRTVPSPLSTEHRFMLSPLLPDTPYRIFIEGETPDGRRYTSASGTFRPLPTGDQPGAPPAPESIAITISREGPKLSWAYNGTDPLAGFRVYKAVENELLELWRDESLVFPNERSVVDEYASPGVRLRFALEALDLDGNVSSLSQEVSLFPGGELVSDVTWKKEWSPIDLFGDILVPAGLTFTIEPGTTIRVSPSDLSQHGIDPDLCEILVEGRMIVAASGTSPVRFISASSQPTREDWSGIRILTPRNYAPSEISNLEVTNARVGMLVGDSPLWIDSFTARYCKTGMALEGASGTSLAGFTFWDCGTAFSAEGTYGCGVSDITARGGETGILLSGNRGFQLKKFDVRQISDTGLQLEDTASSSVRGGVVSADRIGARVRSGAAEVQFLTIEAPAGIIIDGGGKPDLRNCIVTNLRSSGTGVGIEERTQGRSYPYNNMFGYQFVTKNCNQDGGPIINSDPLFVGGSVETYDFHLLTGSPLKAAADNGGEMGAYGRFDEQL